MSRVLSPPLGDTLSRRVPGTWHSLQNHVSAVDYGWQKLCCSQYMSVELLPCLHVHKECLPESPSPFMPHPWEWANFWEILEIDHSSGCIMHPLNAWQSRLSTSISLLQMSNFCLLLKARSGVLLIHTHETPVSGCMWDALDQSLGRHIESAGSGVAGGVWAVTVMLWGLDWGHLGHFHPRQFIVRLCSCKSPLKLAWSARQSTGHWYVDSCG